jgi:hypothetical protein
MIPQKIYKNENAATGENKKKLLKTRPSCQIIRKLIIKEFNNDTIKISTRTSMGSP